MTCDLRHPTWYEYPLPALVYDAQRGDPLSAYEVYRYWSSVTKQGGTPHQDAAEFVATEIAKTLDGDQTPAQMIHKGVTKPPQDKSWAHELVSWAGGGEDAIATVAAKIHRSESTVKAHYYDHRKRVKRILRVQSLLDTKDDQNLSWEVRHAAFEELYSMYNC